MLSCFWQSEQGNLDTSCWAALFLRPASAMCWNIFLHFFVLAHISRRFVWGYEQTLETPQVDLKLRWSLIRERRANALNRHKVLPTRGKNGSGGRWCSGAMKNPIHHHNFTDWSINIFGLWVLSALINAKHYRFLAFLMDQQLWWYEQKFPFLWQPLVFLGVCNSSPIYWLSLNISSDSTVNRMKYGNIITVLFARTVGKSSSESSKVNTMI